MNQTLPINDTSIRITNVSKTFGSVGTRDCVKSLDSVTAEIRQGSIFGLIGSNGAGKSTLLRVMAGILLPDSGGVTYAGREVYENTALKQEIVYLSDDQFFFPHGTIADMADYYRRVYDHWSDEKYDRLRHIFNLEADRRINTFSKGMRKQASVLLALSCCPKYLLCDETFDGLDPVMRQFVKRLFAEEVADGNLTPIIASHNMRELEDICDHIGLLHKGGILFDREVDELKSNIHKVQLVLTNGTPEAENVYAGHFGDLPVVSTKRSGSVFNLVVRGSYEAVTGTAEALNPVFYELVPLTLEEIFICEMEEKGYDFDGFIG
ncbi:MAG: ABC transporter ATP-binding protein [Clostridia bacterium]|nr:ABC transporter ATP-binding protein [Clostridia bacterium]